MRMTTRGASQDDVAPHRGPALTCACHSAEVPVDPVAAQAGRPIVAVASSAWALHVLQAKAQIWRLFTIQGPQSWQWAWQGLAIPG